MIDICPVGALTSKPFRYSARTWELGRRKSISPHDSTGANLIVQVKNNKVMRVVPFENEEVNECWISDRDRFSYEALNSEERLTTPMIKHGGEWKTVDWQTALEYVANGLKQIKADHGAASLGALVSPQSTLEELYLAAGLMRGLGSDNIDYRLRHAEFEPSGQVRWLGTSIASLSNLDRALIVGSNIRKDHPLFAQRIRQAVRKGCAVNAINTTAIDATYAPANALLIESKHWSKTLAEVAAAIATSKGIDAPVAASTTEAAKDIAASMLSGERKAIFLGNAAAHHPQASSLLALANWIGLQTGASVGYLTEAGNTVGAQWVGAQPTQSGLNAGQMLAGGLKAVILLNNEPEFDATGGAKAKAVLGQAQMVVSMNPFKANMDFCDVILPISPFTETSGTLVNAEGRLQSFHAVVKPLGETRPAWKVLRVLANMLDLPGFDFDASTDVLNKLTGQTSALSSIPVEKLGNLTASSIDLSESDIQAVSAAIYQVDGIVRRASSLQMTADARSTFNMPQEVNA
jgi:NADH-quinone oxidoreductase subunit G